MNEAGMIERFATDEEARKKGFHMKLTAEEALRLLEMPKEERVAEHVRVRHVQRMEHKEKPRREKYPGQNTAHLRGAHSAG